MSSNPFEIIIGDDCTVFDTSELKNPNELVVIYLCVGQGDCTLILFPDGKTTWMIDCGSRKKAQGTLNALINNLNALLSARGNCIDTLILTHPDEDHYNLLKKIITPCKIKITQIIYGGEANLYQNKNENNYTYLLLTKQKPSGTKVSSATDAIINANLLGHSQSIGNTSITYLSANFSQKVEIGKKRKRQPSGFNKNNTSIVFMLEYQSHKFLFMADAEKEVEDYILNAFKSSLSEKSILKLGHHGSDTSSTPEWIKATKPSYIIASAGTLLFNGTGMPKESKIKEIEQNDSCLSKNICSHSYVYFSPTKPLYRTSSDTLLGEFTTLYGAKEYTAKNKKMKYMGLGGSYFFSVTSTAPPNISFKKDNETPTQLPEKEREITFSPLPDLKNGISVADLQKLLKNNPFTLTRDQLAIDGAADIFKLLPNLTLTVTNPIPSPKDLTLTGSMAFPFSNSGNVNVEISFPNDSKYVTGILIRMQWPNGWEIKINNKQPQLVLDLNAASLQTFGCSSLYLLLGTTSDQEAGYGLGVDYTFKKQPLELNSSLIPLASTNPSFLSLESSFAGIKTNLLDLKLLIGDQVSIPTLVPTNSLYLCGLQFLLDPTSGSSNPLQYVSVELSLKDDWKPLPFFQFETTILSLTYFLPNKSLSSAIYALFVLDGQFDVEVSIQLPSLELEARLTEPLNISNVFSHLGLGSLVFPDLSINYFAIDANLSSKTYTIACGISENWTPFPGFTLSNVFFTFSEGGSLSGQAQFIFGEVILLISVSYDPSTGWLLDGGTPEGSTAQINIGKTISGFFGTAVPLPDFITNLQVSAFDIMVDISNRQVTLNTQAIDDDLIFDFSFTLSKGEKSFLLTISRRGKLLLDISNHFPDVVKILLGDQPLGLQTIELSYDSAFTVSGTLLIEGKSLPFSSQTSSSQTSSSAFTFNDSSASTAMQPIWLSLKKHLGPLYLEQISF